MSSREVSAELTSRTDTCLYVTVYGVNKYHSNYEVLRKIRRYIDEGLNKGFDVELTIDGGSFVRFKSFKYVAKENQWYQLGTQVVPLDGGLDTIRFTKTPVDINTVGLVP